MPFVPEWAKPAAILGLELQIATLEANPNVSPVVITRAKEKLEIIRRMK